MGRARVPVPAAANQGGRRPAGPRGSGWPEGPGGVRSRAPLLPAPPAARGLGAAGGGAQALGLFRMSSTSASTISRTSSWDPRERAVGASGASVPLCWGHRRPRGGLHPVARTPIPGTPCAQLPARPAPSRGDGLGLAGAPPCKGHLHQKRPGASSSASVLLWCSLPAESPTGRRERRAWWVAVCARTPARPRPPAPGAPAALLGVSAPRAALALGAVNLAKFGGVPRGGQEVTAARASAEAPWL